MEAYRYLRIPSALRKIGWKKSLNILINLIEEKIASEKLISHPLFLDIVPTMRCNLHCIFCIQYPSQVKYLSLDAFNKIAETFFPFAYEVLFCSSGEPFMNKYFMEFLDICKKWKVYFTVVTNGTLLSEEKCSVLLANEYLKTFTFSFDGIRKETLESIRRGVNYQIVVNNMQTIGAMKKWSGVRSPLLTIRYTVMKRNIEELPDLILFAKEIGFDKVTVSYLNTANDIDSQESLYFHPELTKRSFDIASDLSKKGGIALELPPKLKTDFVKVNKCNYPWRFIKIDPDGSVRFCYKAWQNPIGNILTSNDISSIWNNTQYRSIRRTINTYHPYFKYCSICDARKGFSAQHNHISGDKKDLYSFDNRYKILH